MKFAVDRALDHKKYETGDIGQSLLRVLEYYTMKNQFDEVCPELAEIGVTKIEVTSEGLKFHGAIKHDSDEWDHNYNYYHDFYHIKLHVLCVIVITISCNFILNKFLL